MIQRRLVTTALRDLIATATGRPCGLATVPLINGNPAPPPYTLLYPLDNTLSGAPYADMHEDASLLYQITIVSGPDPDDPDSRGGVEQAEWLADTIRTAVLGRDPATRQWVHPLTVPGAACIGRRVDTEPGATSAPDDAIITYVIRVRLDWTTTA